MSDDERLLTLATDWIAGDPDPGTRAELQALVDAEDVETLRERVDGSLQFGTAGLRGVVGAGPLRMNRAVVIRTTKGLADHLRDTVDDLDERVVVVGFDARHDSRRFAADTVGVLAATGIRVRLFTQPTPTPVVAYAARALGAAAAVVVTASHNPPEYNGYKVYGPNAAQIVPPTDQRIAEAIAAAPPADDVDRVEAPLQSDLVEPVGDDVLERYLAEVDDHRTPPDDPGDLRIVYTPLHGVAWRPLRRAFERAGYGDVHVVEEQAEPDPAFPTVRFPNPEEEGALDLAVAAARDVDADLVLASDPDGDRLAVAVPHDGAWRLLTGNQLGVLLGDDVLAQGSGDERMVLSSIVSSPMLRDVAAAHGVRYEATLTGFKWIWNAALDLERDEGLRYVFGYEEALGYSVGPTVRDKDGISAALAFADLTARLKAEGRTVMDELADLYRRHGLWTSIQHSVTRPGSEGQAEIAAAMQRIGHEQPSALGGREVLVVTDYRRDEDARPRWLPATPLVSLELAGGSRVLIRPSGTEPKCKIYVDLRADLARDDVWEREAQLRDEAQGIGEELASFVGLT